MKIGLKIYRKVLVTQSEFDTVCNKHNSICSLVYFFKRRKMI